jgi:hypothetical protein
MSSAGAVGASGTTRSVCSGSTAHNTSEEQSFVRCARVSQWLQKSTSGVRSREAAPVAAGEADGDIARAVQLRAKRRRERVPRSNCLARVKSPRRVACWQQALGVVKSGSLSRGQGGSGIGWLADLAWPGSLTSDTGVRGRNLRHVVGVNSAIQSPATPVEAGPAT